MMTQTHILVGLAVFGRPRDLPRNLAAIAGGIVPDGAIFLLYAIEKSRGTPEREIWTDIYFSQFWQDVVAWGNSIPLWVILFACGVLLCVRTRFKISAGALMVFSASCLAHLACDLPVHVDDAHRHLFPLSDWRFRSPVSYWDPEHFGVQFALFEAVLGIALSFLMWRRFESLPARVGIAFLSIGYFAVPAWFAFQFLR